MKYTKFLLALSLQGIISTPNANATTKKKKATAKIATTAETKQKTEDRNIDDYEMATVLLKLIDSYMPQTVCDFNQNSLVDNEMANSVSKEQENSFKNSLSHIKDKVIKEKLFSDIDCFNKNQKKNINNFLKLKFFCKMFNIPVIIKDLALSAIKENQKLDTEQALKNMKANCVQRLNSIISKFEAEEKKKTRLPNKLKNIIKSAKLQIKNFPKEINRDYEEGITTLIFYILELEIELKYIHVTNYIETLK